MSQYQLMDHFCDEEIYNWNAAVLKKEEILTDLRALSQIEGESKWRELRKEWKQWKKESRRIGVDAINGLVITDLRKINGVQTNIKNRLMVVRNDTQDLEHGAATSNQEGELRSGVEAHVLVDQLSSSMEIRKWIGKFMNRRTDEGRTKNVFMTQQMADDMFSITEVQGLEEFFDSN